MKWGKAAALLMGLLLAFSPVGPALGAEAVLENGDRFYEEHLEEALPASESRTFEVGYRVCWPEDAQTDVPETATIQYDLILTNKTGQALKDLRFTAHFPESMQMALAAPHWYNEPMELGAAQPEGVSDTVVYTWNPFVMLKDLAIVGEVPLSDFYDMLLEVEWEGGGEILRLDPDSVWIPQEMEEALEDYPALNQAKVDAMMEEGRAILEEELPPGG